MLLEKVVAKYCLRRDVTETYQYTLNYAVKRLSLHLNRPPTTEDLDPDVLSKWLQDEQRAGRLSDRSRRNIRASLITISKAANVQLASEEVRQVKVAPRSPEAWHYEELCRVVDAAGKLPGTMKNGLPRGRYFAAVLWFAFETGLRRRDIMNFDIGRLGEDRRAALTQNKSKQVHVIEVTEATLEDLKFLSERLRVAGIEYWRTPLHWPHDWKCFYAWMRRARKAAGVDADVMNRSLQHLRRTGATAVECKEPDTASKYLGHRSGGALAWASYIDPRKVRRTIMPPAVRPDVRFRSEQIDSASGGDHSRASCQAS